MPLVRKLIDAGADVNLGDRSPLENALKFGSTCVVMILLEAGADVSRLSTDCEAKLRSKFTDPTVVPKDMRSLAWHDLFEQPAEKLRLLAMYRATRMYHGSTRDQGFCKIDLDTAPSISGLEDVVTMLVTT